MTTTNSYESAFDMAKQAFAPFADSFKAIQDKVQVPEAARDFVKRVAGDATARAENIHAGAEKVTVAIQTAVADQVDETAKITRSIQQAMLDDAQAFFAGIEKLAAATVVRRSLPDPERHGACAHRRCGESGPRDRRLFRRAFRHRCEDRPGEPLQGRVVEQGSLIGDFKAARRESPPRAGFLFAPRALSPLRTNRTGRSR